MKYVQIFSIVNFEHVIAGWVKEYLLNLEYMSIPLISTLSRVILSTIFTWTINETKKRILNDKILNFIHVSLFS